MPEKPLENLSLWILFLAFVFVAWEAIQLPTKPPKAPKAIGIIESYSHDEKKRGLGTLIGEKEGITAAHVLEETYGAQLTLGGKTYPITSWEKISRPGRKFPEEDLALFQLASSPPNTIKRIPISTEKPSKTDMFLAYQKNHHIELSRKTPFKIDGYTAITNTPREIYQGILWLNSDPFSDNTLIREGDSGSPWIQNGKIIAVTSSIQPLSHSPSKQMIFGCGVWDHPTPPIKHIKGPPIAHRPLLLTLICLLVIMRIKKKGVANKQKPPQNTL